MLINIGIDEIVFDVKNARTKYIPTRNIEKERK